MLHDERHYFAEYLERIPDFHYFYFSGITCSAVNLGDNLTSCILLSTL